MTLNWNELIGKKPEATQPAPAATDLTAGFDHSALNLANIAQPPEKKSGNVATNFIAGFGSQFVHTIADMTGATTDKMTQALKAGGSGVGANGSAGDVAENFVTGLGKTGSLLIHHPSAIAALPGQIYTNFRNADANGKADMAGQAAFIVGSLFVGGEGAANAGRVAGDLREASVATRAADTLAETGTAATRLETATAAAAARTTDVLGAASHVDGVLGETGRLGSTAARLDGVANAVEPLTSGLSGAASWADRVLPSQSLARTSASEFLGNTTSAVGRAGSLDVGTTGAGLTTRFLQGTRDVAENLSAKWSGFTSKFTSTDGTLLSRLTHPTGLASDLERGTEVGAATTPSTESALSALLGRGATHESGVVSGTESALGRVSTTTGDVAHTTSELGALTGDAERASQLPGLANDLGRASELPVAGNLVRTADHISNAAPMFGAFTDTAAADAGALARVTETSVPRLAETPFTESGTAAGLARVTESGAPRLAKTALTTPGTAADLSMDAGRLTENLLASGTRTADPIAAGVARATEDITATGARSAESLTADASRVSRVSDAATAVTEQGANVSREATSLGERLAVRGTETPQSLAEFQQASEGFARAGTDVERTAQMSRMQEAATKLATEFPEESAPLLQSMKTLETQTANYSRISRVNEALGSVETQTGTLSQATSRLSEDLASRGVTETAPSVRDLSAATERMANASSDAERLSALQDVQRASTRVATEFPQESAEVVRAAGSLGDQVANASRLEKLEQASTELTTNASRVGTSADALTEAASGSTRATQALADMRQSADTLATATTTAERAEQASQMSRQMSVLRDELGSNATADLAANVERMQSQATAIERLESAEGAASRVSTVTNASEVASGLSNSGRVSEALEGASGTAEAADAGRIADAPRLQGMQAAQSVSGNVASNAGRLSDELTALRATDTAAGEAEQAMTRLGQNADRVAASSTIAQPAERLAQMSDDAATIERTFGSTATQSLRTSVSSIADDSGTLSRLGAVENSTEQVSLRAQAVVDQANAIRTVAGADSATASSALASISSKAAQISSGTVSASQATNFASEISALESSIGSGSLTNLSTALGRLQEAEGSLAGASSELLNYQGAKISQSISAIQSGELSVSNQISQLQQLQNDLLVFKSSLPADSPLHGLLADMQTNTSAVDALSNILAHPEVARASARKLVELAENGDAATARAAADRLILAGRSGNALNSPVSGLVSERARFWDSANQVTRLQEAQSGRLFGSGKVFGLSTSDPTFGQLSKHLAFAVGGLGWAGANLAYNIDQAGVMAQDILRNRELQAAAVKAQSEGRDGSADGAQPKPGAVDQNAVNEQAARDKAASDKAARDQASNQAAFNGRAHTPELGAALNVYGTPRYSDMAAENQFPVYGASSFSALAQQYGGNPWGWLRGPGEVAAAEEAQVVYAQQQPMRRGRITDGSDQTKVANARFPMPRISSLTSQSALLGLSSQMANGKRRETSISTSTPKSWQTLVQWSQLGGMGGAGGKYGYGHNVNLSGLENTSESGVDGQGGVSTSGNGQQQGQVSNVAVGAVPASVAAAQEPTQQASAQQV